MRPTAWEEKILDVTPFEEVGGVWWKREDKFAPLGYGGINGSKLRQCIWLIGRAARAGAKGVVSGSSVKSPQISMGTAVARHFGLPSVHVLGATKAKTALRHENVLVAAWMGARFVVLPVGYNPVLQAKVRELADGPLRGYFQLEYGISLGHQGHPPEDVAAFHRLGARQTTNIPAGVRTLYMPAGSCNSCVSVLYGLALFPPPSLRRVVLFGIGPTRLAWIHERLGVIERATGQPIRSRFERKFHQNSALEAEQNSVCERPGFVVEHFDLHHMKFASYQDEMPFSFQGIELHPTYEGKVLSYMQANPRPFGDFWGRNGRAAFWIVGSKPRASAMPSAFLGAPPTRLPLASLADAPEVGGG